jgi:hypothetical protein
LGTPQDVAATIQLQDQVMTSVGGAGRFVGGSLEAAVSGTAAVVDPEPASKALLAFSAAHGVDQAQAGFRTAWSGEYQRTLTSEGVDYWAQKLGANPKAAYALGEGVNLGFSLAGGAYASYRLATPAFVSETGTQYVYAPSIGSSIENEGHNAALFAQYKQALTAAEIENPGNSMSGPVLFNGPLSGATAAEEAEIMESVSLLNLVEREGYLSPTGRVSTSGALRADANKFAAIERARAAEAGTPYQGFVGHAADTTWTNRPDAAFWVDVSQKINSSMGSQAKRYPLGYFPTRFVYQGEIE